MEQGNDYLVGVKGNQPKLLLAIQQAAQQQTPVAQQVERERTRNRVVERTVSIYNDISAIDSNWVGAQSLIVVRRQGTRQGVSFDKLSYYLSSLALPAVEFGLGIRGHRLIENGLHARHAMWSLARMVPPSRPTMLQPIGLQFAVLT